MKNKILIIMLVFLIFLMPNIMAYTWWNTTWQQRYNISIPSSYDYRPYSVNITNTSCYNKLNTTRLVYNDQVLVPFVFDGVNDTTYHSIIFIANLSNNVTAYNLYCNSSNTAYEVWGNSSAFLFWDTMSTDINGAALDTNKYTSIATCSGCKVNYSNGGIKMTSTAADTFMQVTFNTTTQFGRTSDLYACYQSSTDPGQHGHSFGLWSTVSTTTGNNNRSGTGWRDDGSTFWQGVASNWNGDAPSSRVSIALGAVVNINWTLHWNSSALKWGYEIFANQKYISMTQGMTDQINAPLRWVGYDGASFNTTFDNILVTNQRINCTDSLGTSTVLQPSVSYSITNVNQSIITLTKPASNYKFNVFTSQIDFNFTVVSEGTSLNNCSLWTNESGTWGIHGIITPPVNNSNNRILNNISSVDAEGNYRWNVQCCLIDGTCNFGTNLTFFVDLTSPIITLGSDSFFSSTNTTVHNFNMSNVKINLTFTDNIGIYAHEIFITKGSIFYNFTNLTLTGTRANILMNVSLNNSEGNYTVNITVWDTHTANNIEPMKVDTKIDSLTFDNKIKITAVGAIESSTNKKTDRYTFDFKYPENTPDKIYYIESNAPLSYIADSKYPGHFVDWVNKKWIDFDSKIGIPTVKKINDYKYLVTFSNAETEIKFNSIGGLNSRSLIYYYYVSNPTLAWSIPNSIMSSTLLIDGNLSVSLNSTGEYQFNATLYLFNETKDLIRNISLSYNGSGLHQYNTTFSLLTNNMRILYINATVNDQFGSMVYSPTYTIYYITLDNCSASNNVVLNFSSYDENNINMALNTTAEVEGNYWINNDPSTTGNISYTFINYYYHEMCIFMGQNITVNTNLYFKYTVDTGFTHRYYLINQSLINQTLQISVYNYNVTTGTSDLKITAREKSTYNYYSGIYAKLQRFYIGEGLWRTVQMDKTGDYGLIFFNIIEQTVDYRFIFVDENGYPLKTTDSMKFACSAGICDVTYLLDAYSTISGISPYLVYSVLYNNNTKNITLTWSDSTDLTKYVRLTASKQDLVPPVYICDKQVNSSAGTILCPFGLNTGSITVNVYSSASPETPLWTTIIQVFIGTIEEYIGTPEAMMWVGFIMLVVVGASIYSPVTVVLSVPISLIFCSVLGLTNAITIGAILISGALGVVLAWLFRN